VGEVLLWELGIETWDRKGEGQIVRQGWHNYKPPSPIIVSCSYLQILIFERMKNEQGIRIQAILLLIFPHKIQRICMFLLLSSHSGLMILCQRAHLKGIQFKPHPILRELVTIICDVCWHQMCIQGLWNQDCTA